MNSLIVVDYTKDFPQRPPLWWEKQKERDEHHSLSIPDHWNGDLCGSKKMETKLKKNRKIQIIAVSSIHYCISKGYDDLKEAAARSLPVRRAFVV